MKVFSWMSWLFITATIFDLEISAVLAFRHIETAAILELFELY